MPAWRAAMREIDSRHQRAVTLYWTFRRPYSKLSVVNRNAQRNLVALQVVDFLKARHSRGYVFVYGLRPC
ncbi:hypothetical protein PSAB6_10202 [Paraburkholderia sabiae]|nr:hypothetical protein PSAB6_10202 [Paraburkholderia sabiae]